VTKPVKQKKTPPKRAAKAKPSSAEKQRGNSAKRSRGKPFEKGNPHAFQPGQSGNPNGRPKRTKLSEALLVKLAEDSPDAGEATVAEAVADALIKRALIGDVQAIREIGDRTEGRPKQAVELDARLLDWREFSRANGLNELDVLAEAKRIIAALDAESAADGGGTTAG
jgi:hypothetical protein